MSTEDALTGDDGKTTATTSTGTPRSTASSSPRHRGDAGQVPGGLDRHLRRPLGRGRQQGGLRARPLPEYLSNDHDVTGERRGYKGITIPVAPDAVPRRLPGDGPARAAALPAGRSTRTCRRPRSSAGRRSSTRSSGPAWTRRSRAGRSTSSTTSPTSCRPCSPWRCWGCR